MGTEILDLSGSIKTADGWADIATTAAHECRTASLLGKREAGCYTGLAD
jgi:hypothetical protein